MSINNLKDDLLSEFREEQKMIYDQIEILDPLGVSLRKPAAKRLISKGALIITEIICYLITLGGIAFIAQMHKLYPFSILHDIFYNPQFQNLFGEQNLLYLVLAFYGITAAGVLLIFIIGRMAHKIRLKNAILNLAGKDINIIVGQHLERKAAIDTLEQRHMLGTSSIGQPKKEVLVIEVMNPGFED